MIKIVATRPISSSELVKQSFWLSEQTKRLHNIITNMPSFESWKMILDELNTIKNTMNTVEKLIQEQHHSRPLPEWMKNHTTGVNIDQYV